MLQRRKITLQDFIESLDPEGASGQKCPHPLDCEVIPAPDAMAPAQNPEANLSSSVGDDANVSFQL